MKKTFALCLLLAITFATHAQISKSDCDCPKPIGGKFVQIEVMVENQDSDYKKALMEMACADPKTDSPETVKTKVKCMWEKYYAEFGCNSTGFLVANGNILKYAINQEFEYFVDGMVEEFGISINMKDPSDGKTLLDFVLDEINRYKNDKNYQYKVPELQRTYNHLKNEYYALHANELVNKPQWERGVKINLTIDIMKRYPGKYLLQLDTALFNYSIVLENGKLFLSVNNGKSSEINAETETIFFIKPKSMYRYIFNLNEKTGNYDLTIQYGTGKNKTTRVE